MGFQEYQQSLKWIAQNGNKNNLMTGKVFIKRDNDRYDCIILGDQNIVMPNLLPANPREEYNIGDEVFIGLPWGSLSILRILMRSNTSIPTEKIFTFRTKPTVSSGSIYLACPGENAVKIYSLLGEENVAISIPERYPTDICTVGAYIYASCDYGFYMYKFKPDGSEFSVIVESGGSEWYRDGDVGLAVDSTYLYCLFNYGIARINILNGDIEPEWKGFNWLDSNTEFEDVLEATDLCGNSDYLFVVGNIYSGGGQVVIRIFDYSGNFISEISFYSTDTYKITADNTNIYLYSSTSVKIYTNAGTFVRSISENGIRAVAVKDGKLYIVTEENSEGGAT